MSTAVLTRSLLLRLRRPEHYAGGLAPPPPPGPPAEPSPSGPSSGPSAGLAGLAGPAGQSVTGPAFPTHLGELTHVRHLGGSTGAHLMRDPQGQHWVRKAGASPGHLLEEHHANQAYAAAGVPVPRSQLYTTPAGPVQLAEHIPGTRLDELEEIDPEAARLAHGRLAQHFAADALLGNRDVLGSANDNIIVHPSGTPYRVDNGGALRYRARGRFKTDFGDEANEVDSMRDPSVTRAAAVFGGLSDDEVHHQIGDLVSRGGAILSALPAELRPVVAARLRSLGGRVSGGQPEHYARASDLGGEEGEPLPGGSIQGRRKAFPENVAKQRWYAAQRSQRFGRYIRGLGGPSAQARSPTEAPAPAPPSAALPPGEKTPRGVAFVSPETASGLDYPAAIQRVHSPEHQRWLQASEDVDRRLGLQAETHPAIGDWAPAGETPGAEPSSVTYYHNVPSLDRLKYAAAVKGRLAQQLAVIPFVHRREGSDTLWRLDVDAAPDQARQALDAHGLAYRTLQPTEQGTRIHIFDQGSGLAEIIDRLAHHFGTEAHHARGQGEFFPAAATDRDDARRQYEAFMRDYEQTNPHIAPYQLPVPRHDPGGGGGDPGDHWDWRHYYARRDRATRLTASPVSSRPQDFRKWWAARSSEHYARALSPVRPFTETEKVRDSLAIEPPTPPRPDWKPPAWKPSSGQRLPLHDPATGLPVAGEPIRHGGQLYAPETPLVRGKPQPGAEPLSRIAPSRLAPTPEEPERPASVPQGVDYDQLTQRQQTAVDRHEQRLAAHNKKLQQHAARATKYQEEHQEDLDAPGPPYSAQLRNTQGYYYVSKTGEDPVPKSSDLKYDEERQAWMVEMPQGILLRPEEMPNFKSEDQLRWFQKLVDHAVANTDGVLPTVEMIKGAAHAGRSVKGQYATTHRVMNDLLGDHDEATWAGVNAVLSAQTPADVHTEGSLRVMAAWMDTGHLDSNKKWVRETDPRKLARLVESQLTDLRRDQPYQEHIPWEERESSSMIGVSGDKVKHIVELLQKADRGETITREDVSRSKPDERGNSKTVGGHGKEGEFFDQLLGRPGTAIDTHLSKPLNPEMLRELNWSPETTERFTDLLHSSPEEAGRILDSLKGLVGKGKDPALYLAYHGVLQKAAQQLTAETKEHWTASHVQETVWATIVSVAAWRAKRKPDGGRYSDQEIVDNLRHEDIRQAWSIENMVRGALEHQYFRLETFDPQHPNDSGQPLRPPHSPIRRILSPATWREDAAAAGVRITRNRKGEEKFFPTAADWTKAQEKKGLEAGNVRRQMAETLYEVLSRAKNKDEQGKKLSEKRINEQGKPVSSDAVANFAGAGRPEGQRGRWDQPFDEGGYRQPGQDLTGPVVGPASDSDTAGNRYRRGLELIARRLGTHDVTEPPPGAPGIVHQAITDRQSKERLQGPAQVFLEAIRQHGLQLLPDRGAYQTQARKAVGRALMPARRD